MKETLYIFLDFDGVLNSARYRYKQVDPEKPISLSIFGGPEDIDPEAVATFNQLVTRLTLSGYEIRIVISSMWRVPQAPQTYPERVEELKSFLTQRGMDCASLIVGSTPNFYWAHPSKNRGDEIAHWLNENAEVPYRLLLIDDSDKMGEVLPYLFKTRDVDGLLPMHVPLIVDKVNAQEPVYHKWVD